MSDLHPSSGPAGHDDDSLLPGDPDSYVTGEQPAVDGRRAAGGSRRAPKKKRGKGLGCLLVALVLIAGVVGGLYAGVSWVADRINGSGEPDDFEGVASVEECATGGDVEITVPAGYSAGQIGSLLAEKGVVASSGAFTAAVANDSVRDGTRTMCEGMTGAQAAELMTNADYIGGGGITITAGYTKGQTFDLLAGATGIPVADFEAAAEDPSLPLPAEAGGDVEGYLYPDSYDFGSDPTAVSILTQMVERWSEAATEAGLVDDAVPGFTQHELLTLASIIQKEVLLPEERPQVAEVIYDRLADQCAGVPAGMLQMDSTVNFIKGANTGTPFTTEEDRQIDDPYNTYKYPGLPPGPIGAPSEATMEAAVNPSSEGYCYFVAAGDGSNSSYFASEYADHLENVDRANSNRNG